MNFSRDAVGRLEFFSDVSPVCVESQHHRINNLSHLWMPMADSLTHPSSCDVMRIQNSAKKKRLNVKRFPKSFSHFISYFFFFLWKEVRDSHPRLHTGNHHVRPHWEEAEVRRRIGPVQHRQPLTPWRRHPVAVRQHPLGRHLFAMIWMSSQMTTRFLLQLLMEEMTNRDDPGATSDW